MAKMFGYRWADGNWYDGPEPRPQQPGIQPKPKRQWVPTGFFKDSKPMSRRTVRLKAENARLWLCAALRKPMSSRDIYALASAEGISPRSLRRAKRRLGIKSFKRGGRQYGYGARWYWQPIVSE